MNNQKFDHLIKDLTNSLVKSYVNILGKHQEFNDEVDTSPLLNLTISVFMSSFVSMLEIIKSNTEGELKLMENIELTKATIMKAIEELPFMNKVEYF